MTQLFENYFNPLITIIIIIIIIIIIKINLEFNKKLNIPKFILNKIQKYVILETCRIVRKIMNIND
jgi:hypothetical protein